MPRNRRKRKNLAHRMLEDPYPEGSTIIRRNGKKLKIEGLTVKIKKSSKKKE